MGGWLFGFDWQTCGFVGRLRHGAEFGMVNVYFLILAVFYTFCDGFSALIGGLAALLDCSGMECIPFTYWQIFPLLICRIFQHPHTHRQFHIHYSRRTLSFLFSVHPENNHLSTWLWKHGCINILWFFLSSIYISPPGSAETADKLILANVSICLIANKATFKISASLAYV